MKKIVFIVLFGFYAQLIANDCFKIDGDIRCNNDVFDVPIEGPLVRPGLVETVLLKVYDVGRGQVSWELYMFDYNTNSEEGLKGKPYSKAYPYVYEPFKIGEIKKIYSNTPSGRKAIWQKIKVQREKEAKVIRSYISKCEKGAAKIAKGNQEAAELLTKHCFLHIRLNTDFEDFFKMEHWQQSFPDLKDKLLFPNYKFSI